MATTIPPNVPVLLEAQLPDDIPAWPGPPSWETSDPAGATIRLTDDGGQFVAELTATTHVSVRVMVPDYRTEGAPGLSGTIDFDVAEDAPIPGAPIPISLT